MPSSSIPEDPAVEIVIDARARSVGGAAVRRVLPHARRRAVGPLVFLDHFGPVTILAGVDFDVRPHPHIGLATVTWLWEGRMRHRDSLGNDQIIVPGDVNLMTAGRGIVHSERTPEADRGTVRRAHGLQLWLALPAALEDCEPAFAHHGPADLPRFSAPGAAGVVLVGEAFGVRSAVAFPAGMLYVDVELEAGATLELPAAPERCVYVVDGAARVGATPLAVGQLAVVAGGSVSVSTVSGAHVVVLGGEPLDGPRLIEWNFVATDQERIEAAKQRWRDRAFDAIPGDDEEFIPLP